MLPETKEIAGVLHYRVRCTGCGEWVWTGIVGYKMRHRYTCDSCFPRLGPQVGNAHPAVPKSERNYHGGRQKE